jgi:hypothetical protein
LSYINYAIPASGSTQFYNGQMLGRNSSGYIVNIDDTAQVTDFAGLEQNTNRSAMLVQSTDAVGDKRSQVYRPLLFTMAIAAAAAGDEGKKVYALYNNQVSYTSTFGNYVGKVWRVIDATHVEIIPPWVGYVRSTPVVSVTAAGSAQGNAAALADNAYNAVSGAGSPTGQVLLPPGQAGDWVIVQNLSTTTVLAVYPPVGAQINAKAVNTAYDMSVGAQRFFIYRTATQIDAEPEIGN